MINAPFGIYRVEAVLDELGLRNAREAHYAVLKERRAVKQAACKREGTHLGYEVCPSCGYRRAMHLGADAGLRKIAAALALRDAGGLVGAICKSSVTQASRDLRRWVEEGSWV